MTTLLSAPLLALLLSAGPIGTGQIDPTLLAATDIDGTAVDGRVASATVVVFLKTGCPIANYYHPTLRRLADDLADRSVLLMQVHATGAVTAEQAAAHRKEYDVAGHVVVDPGQTLARALGAEVTPEAFVILPSGQVTYRGRIDDIYVGFGRRRQAASEATLADAVDATLAGEPVKVAVTKPVGCRIHYAD